MTDIMLVDDEVLALEYLKNMVDWERNGYHVVGCATSGKKALELFDRTHPLRRIQLSSETRAFFGTDPKRAGRSERKAGESRQ